MLDQLPSYQVERMWLLIRAVAAGAGLLIGSVPGAAVELGGDGLTPASPIDVLAFRDAYKADVQGLDSALKGQIRFFVGPVAQVIPGVTDVLFRESADDEGINCYLTDKAEAKKVRSGYFVVVKAKVRGGTSNVLDDCSVFAAVPPVGVELTVPQTQIEAPIVKPASPVRPPVVTGTPAPKNEVPAPLVKAPAASATEPAPAKPIAPTAAAPALPSTQPNDSGTAAKPLASATIVDDYNNDSTVADARYTGKKLYVRGKVTFNNSTFALYDEPTIMFEGIICHLKNKHDEARAPKDKEVTISGTGDGFGFGGVHIAGCEVVSP